MCRDIGGSTVWIDSLVWDEVAGSYLERRGELRGRVHQTSLLLQGGGAARSRSWELSEGIEQGLPETVTLEVGHQEARGEVVGALCRVVVGCVSDGDIRACCKLRSRLSRERRLGG